MKESADFIKAPVFADLDWLEHGFGLRDSAPPPELRTARQIHSSIVLDAGELDANALQDEYPQGDALLSDRPGVRVGVKTADCVPILLADPSMRVVAAIHAGWRGSAANIAGAAVRELAARWQSRPENLRAAIGPSIGVCCYEVGPEVALQFEQWIPKLPKGGFDLSKLGLGKAHLDLPRINELQLRSAGVRDIWKSGECTFCTPERFYSFRREREHAGRLLSFIGLQKNIGRISEDPPGKPSDVF